uniref:Uncharacterized protein n=1 Tax=Inoviridae sp. ctPjN3 TaxID=2826761 RepID=A0A8S5NID4_9VIRU|nr:MAG TPA: hypothetical protein [Inoviridae sp. ctPjN3]
MIFILSLALSSFLWLDTYCFQNEAEKRGSLADAGGKPWRIRPHPQDARAHRPYFE